MKLMRHKNSHYFQFELGGSVCKSNYIKSKRKCLKAMSKAYCQLTGAILSAIEEEAEELKIGDSLTGKYMENYLNH